MKRGTKIVLAITLSVGLIASSIVLVNTNKIFAKEDNKSEISLELVNSQREQSGLSRLHWDYELENAANKKAEDMLAKGYFDHTSPEGKKAWDFILNSGYSYRIAGENLAADFDNEAEAFDAWEKSPTHLSNILSDDYLDYALVVKEGNLDGQKTKVYVQLFGSK